MSQSPTRSREGTPSTASSQSSRSIPGLDRATSSNMSIADPQSPVETDKFRKRMELEQTMQRLQQRLQLASIKAEHGWSDMTINEIENKLPELKLPPTPDRGPSYAPPSPSRPWQLVDVLWQPLPPPTRAYPASPSSPLKRSRTEDEPVAGPSNHSRRASGSHQSPLQRVQRREKKRSQSHSLYRATTQDVNAAKALTAMLGSSSPQRRNSHHAPGLAHNASLPLPPAFEKPTHRRASSVSATPREEKVSPDDTDAAELMMFLAHSPSPATKSTGRFAQEQASPRSMGKAARVLFADDGAGKVEKHSNLVLAPPIGADGERATL